MKRDTLIGELSAMVVAAKVIMRRSDSQASRKLAQHEMEVLQLAARTIIEQEATIAELRNTIDKSSLVAMCAENDGANKSPVPPRSNAGHRDALGNWVGRSKKTGRTVVSAYPMDNVVYGAKKK